MDVNLKNYIRHFRFYFLAILILAVIWALPVSYTHLTLPTNSRV